jgi:predicted acyltransferase
MAASTGQGRGFATFLIGFTAICAGVAYMSTGVGKLALAAGAVIFVASLFGFLKIKPLEGKPAQKAASTGMKLAGAFCAALGWGITLFGLHLVDGTSARIVLALIGIGVSLFGIIYILPSTFNKNAIWKA